MEGMYSNKPVGELVRGPTRATKVGEPEEAPHGEEHGGAGGGPHAKQDTELSEDTLFWSEVHVPLDFSGPLTAFHSVRAEYGE
jgi:hypothetical protein